MASSSDQYNLQRFKEAQDQSYHRVKAEINQGRKQSHWIWFIFPQVQGLGRSSTAEHYSIKSEDEAIAYLQDSLLGGRLNECCQLLLQCKEPSIQKIMGFPDDLKLCSSMTLFAELSELRGVELNHGELTGPENIFRQVLKKFFDSKPDSLTSEKLNQWRLQSD